LKIILAIPHSGLGITRLINYILRYKLLTLPVATLSENSAENDKK
jgi:hypothetical protein